MSDVHEENTTLVIRKDFDELRSRITIIDNKSKTEKWIRAQMQERIASVEAFKGQIISLQGAIETKTEELTELQRRLAALETMTD